ncbi:MULTISPECIES: hypothetical protein [Leptospira]|nr:MULTISPECIES: hypothetical protein [Leptospira]EMO10191.1 hypothetical protein LEP1GSC137_1676 [Leptospira borgpetersenii str. Noumea 25]ALO25314.1 hypothetical protein LBBP_01001 [Leptospira borgpetersenii serovar Ballum]ANH00262.2 Uncharacterized protein LB4E_0798 [Leptospira borgpetersenii str. 4E]AXX15684.1 hypothetical protein C4Q31_09120 [Leptospira borgpetersenii serovar Ceylonica]EKQ93215.1 hypothetical protein LEP1GSC101_3789 [Leptospira borgpetersenii str. UI 09149]
MQGETNQSAGFEREMTFPGALSFKSSQLTREKAAKNSSRAYGKHGQKIVKKISHFANLSFLKNRIMFWTFQLIS